MDRIEICPNCQEKDPILRLSRLDDPGGCSRDYPIPDTRKYGVVCFHCGVTIQTHVIDNTIVALKELRDEMDRLYGKHERFSLNFFLHERQSQR